MTKLQAGADIDAHCNKCDLILAHVIIAMRGDTPAKVECKTCRTVHAYRRQPGAKRTASAGARRATLGAQNFEQLLRGRDTSKPAAYDQGRRFEKDAVIRHPLFGLGVVLRELPDAKVEVAFERGLKILAHARP